ncbi:unnamed protein product [Blepharisma stoltei]|uniref:Uncharacterized protein n=1 Tax=Blepharisma stoltei TaxID=1481888 RepID=A0AAU9KFF8_9CILI|nr:unnamed protein product [Blepharisma stoltei]
MYFRLKSWELYIEALKTPKIPKIIEKISMITRGKYNGKQLLMDKALENKDFVYWKPKTKTVHEIWKKSIKMKLSKLN